jgi:hypothetical protein
MLLRKLTADAVAADEAVAVVDPASRHVVVVRVGAADVATEGNSVADVVVVRLAPMSMTRLPSPALERKFAIADKLCQSRGTDIGRLKRRARSADRRAEFDYMRLIFFS